MKKVIALVLAALMCLSLCACSSSVDSDKVDEILSIVQNMQAQLDELTAGDAAEAEEAEEAPEEEAAAEDIDFTWNGQKEVWSILPTTGAEGLVMINDAMGEIMQNAGFTYVKKDAEGTPSNQVNFVEDAIAAGNVGALMVAAMDVSLLKDSIEEAIDAGIAVVYLGAVPDDYEICGAVYTAYEITGMEAVLGAEDWVQQRVAEGGNVPTNDDGQYEVSLDVYTDITDGIYRSNAMVGTVAASDILVQVAETTAYGDSAYDTAYSNASQVLAANPNCRIFVCYEPEEAMGTAAYIAQYAEDNGLDLADFCVMSCYAEDTTFLDIYNGVLENPSSSAIKGYATYGDTTRNGEEMAGYLCTGYHLADALLYACGIDENDSLATWSDLASGGGYIGGTYYDQIIATNIYGFDFSWVNGETNPAIDYKVTTYTGMNG